MQFFFLRLFTAKNEARKIVLRLPRFRARQCNGWDEGEYRIGNTHNLDEPPGLITRGIFLDQLSKIFRYHGRPSVQAANERYQPLSFMCTHLRRRRPHREKK